MSDIAGALRVYFKSKKSQHMHKRLGKDKEMDKASRKQQRCHNVSLQFIFAHSYIVILQKAHSRLRALQGSTSINEETKKKVCEVLKAEFMSSEDSVTEDEEASNSNANARSGSESDEEGPRRKKGKKS